MRKQVLFIICLSFLLSCRSSGPHNKVWESKRHPSDELRHEYNKANKKGTKDYKNSKKRFQRLQKQKRRKLD